MNSKFLLYLKSYKLSGSIKLYISNDKKFFFIKGLYGFFILRLSSFYFFKEYLSNLNIFEKKKYFILLFLKKNIFFTFIKHFFVYYKRLLKIYCIRLKIRGLGFRIRKISNNLYYFFFNYTNMFYLHIPFNILIKWYKKRLILISNNFFILKLLFSNIILLKKVGPYRLLGIRYPRQLFFLKKKVKKS